MNFPKLLASLQHFRHSVCSSHWFPLQVCMLSTATNTVYRKKQSTQWVTNRESLSGLRCCPDREESVCFSSRTCLCLTYQTLLATLDSHTSDTGGTQGSWPRVGSFSAAQFLPRSASPMCWRRQKSYQNIVCAHVTRELQNVSWAQGRDILHALHLLTEWPTLQNFNIKYCNKTPNLSNKNWKKYFVKRICSDHPFRLPRKSY